MHSESEQPTRLRSALAPLLFVTLLAQSYGLADEPGRLGRLFRFGSSATSSPNASNADHGSVVSSPVREIQAAQSSSPRLIPQPRVSRPVTESDPIVTRVSIGRADQGIQFGMFLQVFADGTVIDSEGVHHVGRDGIKDLVEVLEKGEVFRVKGHCGGPPTDFIEQVFVTVFERSLGRLRASSFSLSGNVQGCDHSVRHLQAALDSLQSRLTRPMTPTSSGVEPVVSSPVTIRLENGSAGGVGVNAR